MVDASAGYQHSLFLTNDGRVFACGENKDGRLGIGTPAASHDGKGCNGRRRPDAHDYYETPQLVQADDIIAIAAGEDHSLFLKRCGKALATGANNYGQLGLGTSLSFTGTPTEVGVDNVVAISAGGPNSLFLQKDGSVYGVGENDYYQVAVGNDDDVCGLRRSQIDDVVAIQTGAYGSAFMTKDGGFHFSGTYELTEVLFGPLDDDYYAPVPWQVHGFNWYSTAKDWVKDSFGSFLSKKYEDQSGEREMMPLKLEPSRGNSLVLSGAAFVACVLCFVLLALAVHQRVTRASGDDRQAQPAKQSVGLMAVEALPEE